jgi:hypothetical protein
MASRNYQLLLEKLVKKQIDELKITPAEFMEFQPVLMNFRQRKRIVGQALPKGIILYHYKENRDK